MFGSKRRAQRQLINALVDALAQNRVRIIVESEPVLQLPEPEYHQMPEPTSRLRKRIARESDRLRRAGLVW